MVIGNLYEIMVSKADYPRIVMNYDDIDRAVCSKSSCGYKLGFHQC